MTIDWMINGFGLGVWWMSDDDGESVLTVSIGPFMLFFGWADHAT